MPTASRRVSADLAFDVAVFSAGAIIALLSVTFWLASGPQLAVAAVFTVPLSILMSRFPLVLTRRDGDAVVGVEACLLVFLAITRPPMEALALWSIGMVLTHSLLRRPPRLRLVNIGATIGGGSLLVAVVALGARLDYTGALEVVTVVVGGSAYFTFGLLVSAVSSVIREGGPLSHTLRWRSVLLGVLCFVGVVSLGYLGAVLDRSQPQWALALLLVPIATLLVAAGSVSEANLAHQRLSGLFEASSQAPDWDDDDLATALAEHAQRMLRDTKAELRADAPVLDPGSTPQIACVLDDPGHPTRYLVARRASTREPYDADDSKALETLAAIGSASLNRRRQADKMAHLARHDALTGLVNRAVFADRLDHALAARSRPGKLAVLYCDLDGFKAINDRLGHESGDQLLIAVADRLRGCVRAGDTAARLGGDEFAVLLEAMPEPQDAQFLAGRVLEAFRVPFTLGGLELRVRVSIGIAYDTDERRGVDLIRSADTAMYRAKALGKGRAEVFDPVMRSANLVQIELEEALRQALDNESLEVAYQPIVELATGRIDGFEALARWTHPTLGVVAPDVFIPIAERLGLIAILGGQVLEQAHATAVTMKERCGRPLTIGVNVAAAQVTEPELSEQIHRLTALAPDIHIVLELTERTLLADDLPTSEALLALQAAGASLAVDDFGAGYSSIGYVHRLPIAIVKVDKSFIQALWDERARTLVQGIIAMADAMGLQVVAEGIEDWVTAAMVRDLGFRLGQGYVLSRPMSVGEALASADSGYIDVAALASIRPVVPPVPRRTGRLHHAATHQN